MQKPHVRVDAVDNPEVFLPRQLQAAGAPGSRRVRGGLLLCGAEPGLDRATRTTGHQLPTSDRQGG